MLAGFLKVLMNSDVQWWGLLSWVCLCPGLLWMVQSSVPILQCLSLQPFQFISKMWDCFSLSDVLVPPPAQSTSPPAPPGNPRICGDVKTVRQAKLFSGLFPSEPMEARSSQRMGQARAKIVSGQHWKVEPGQNAKIQSTKKKQGWELSQSHTWLAQWKTPIPMKIGIPGVPGVSRSLELTKRESCCQSPSETVRQFFFRDRISLAGLSSLLPQRCFSINSKRSILGIPHNFLSLIFFVVVIASYSVFSPKAKYLILRLEYQAFALLYPDLLSLEDYFHIFSSLYTVITLGSSELGILASLSLPDSLKDVKGENNVVIIFAFEF